MQVRKINHTSIQNHTLIIKIKFFCTSDMKELINCPAERAIYFLGGKWKIRILFTLFHNKKVRFNELSLFNYSTNVI